jgi:hydroxyethylthiazole kinase-like uncharacterized protein yjeF
MWIANREHSKSIDTRSSEEFGISAKVLMERAGQAVFEAVKEVLPEGGRIVVFCGKGNNGGDGFVVARLAKENNYTAICLVTLSWTLYWELGPIALFEVILGLPYKRSIGAECR